MTISRVQFAVIMLAALTSQGAAQTIVDGSGRDLPPEVVEGVLVAVSRGLADPISAQIRALQRPTRNGVVLNPSVICGFVNAKNLHGGYVGFQPFAWNYVRGDVKIYQELDRAAPTYELHQLAFELTRCPMSE